MRIDEHIEELRANGIALADVAGERVRCDASGPDVPRVGAARSRPSPRRRAPLGDHVRVNRPHDTDREASDLESYVGGWPPDADLAGWFTAGHAALVAALESAPDDLECWSFLPAPSPRAFWARRQAHETAIHRADANAAAGATPVFRAAFAADGVEELLFGFGGRRGAGMRTVVERSLVLRATDLDARVARSADPGGPRRRRDDQGGRRRRLRGRRARVRPVPAAVEPPGRGRAPGRGRRRSAGPVAGPGSDSLELTAAVLRARRTRGSTATRPRWSRLRPATLRGGGDER